MSTVEEIKSAAAKLAPTERFEILEWLSEADDLRKLRLKRLRQDIAKGIADVERGAVSRLDANEIIAEGRRLLAQRKRS